MLRDSFIRYQKLLNKEESIDFSSKPSILSDNYYVGLNFIIEGYDGLLTKVHPTNKLLRKTLSQIENPLYILMKNESIEEVKILYSSKQRRITSLSFNGETVKELIVRDYLQDNNILSAFSNYFSTNHQIDTIGIYSELLYLDSFSPKELIGNIFIAGVIHNEQSLEEIKNWSKSDVEMLGKNILSQLQYYHSKELYKISKANAKKAALSQILNRNLSHNHGSHLLANLAEDSPDLTFANEYVQKRQRFDRYLRTRMDYLADISTATPVMAAPFYFYKDILLEFEKEKVVLKHISGTQLDCSKKDRFEHFLSKTNDGKTVESKLSEENDLLVSIPNLSLGKHALFNIVENFIRNTAKHNAITDERLNEFTIYIKISDREDDNDFYTISIWNNVIIDSKQLKTICDNINLLIEAPMLNSDGSIRERGWGLLEMKSCALYLQMLPLELIDKRTTDLLEAKAVDGKYLGYEFRLKKVKQAFILDCSNDKLLENQKDPFHLHCKKLGVEMETDCSVLDNLLSKNLEHEFFVFIGNEEQFSDIIKQYSGILPHRQLFINISYTQGKEQIEELVGSINSESLNSFHQYLFAFWTDSILNQIEKPVLIFGDVKQSEEGKKNFSFRDVPNAIIYDRHGELLNDKEKWCVSLTNEQVATCIYYELYHGKDITAWIMKDLKKYPYKQFELLTAGLIDVLVIDERIQQSVENSWTDYVEVNKSKQRKMEKLQWMGIHILDEKTVRLNKSGTFTKEKEGKGILNWILQNIKPDRPQYLVIHLGIIEKIIGTKIEKVNQWIEHLMSEERDNKTFKGIFRNRSGNYALFKNIIIATGRGRTFKLSDQVQYVHYSNLAKYIVEDTSKVHLCQVLLSTRRTY